MSVRGLQRVVGSLAVMTLLVPMARGQERADPYAIDTDRLMFTHVEDDAPIRGEERNHEEFEAYNTVLLHARQFPATELWEHAIRGLAFRDLVTDVRQDYQYKLVAFEGRLKRLRELEPNKPLAEAGVKHLYEAWVFPIGGDSPMCVLTTEPPEGLEPATDYTPAKLVRFAGYSFKLMRYESAERETRQVGDRSVERNRVRQAPLIMAHTMIVLPDAEPDTDGSAPWRNGFFPVLTILCGLIGVTILGFRWYYARGDRPIREMQTARVERNPFDETARGAG